MRRRVLMTGSTGKDRMDAVAGDILCAKADGSKAVFDAEEYDSIPSSWIPIGVVTIPPSHDVYGTGEGAAVSLKWMSYDDPDNGTMAAQRIYYGLNNVYLNIRNGTYINITNNKETPTLTIGSEGYLPIDGIASTECVLDPIVSWSNSPWAPSPYYSDGSKNNDYHTTAKTLFNRLSYFNGFENTTELCRLSTQYPNWKTDSVIKNTTYENHSPAACCCWRYHTIGTSQGDWYLPATGELGYWVVRSIKITQVLSNLGYPLIPASPSWNYAYWSSTPADNGDYGTRAHYAEIGETYEDFGMEFVMGGSMDALSRGSDLYVKAFVRF